MLKIRDVSSGPRVPSRGMACAALGLVMMAGCNRDPEVTTYNAPPDVLPMVATAPPAGVTAAPGLPPPAPPTPEARELAWTLPAGWYEADQPGPFRIATLRAPGGGEGETIDLAITRVPGQKGGITENVNRWRSQIGLPTLDTSQIIPLVQPRSPHDLFGMFTDLEGDAQRTLVAWFELPEASWYFKLTGPREAVAAQRGAFDTLIESVRPAPRPTGASSASARASAAPAPYADPHAGHDHGPGEHHDHAEPATPAVASSVDAPANAFTFGGIMGVLPEGWVLKPEAGPMRIASFEVVGEDAASRGIAPAEASVARFPGDVGGLLANLNRWRNQVGLAPIDVPEAQDAMGYPANSPIARIYRIVNPDTGEAGRAQLAMVVPDATSSWFIKLDGPAAVIAEESGAFVRFIDELRLPLNAPPAQAPTPMPTPTPSQEAAPTPGVTTR